ncbi:hypothetical protein DPMN_168021 [Dreissena polymorpha]|uniref:Uncharacterized protein n=1 Tax=Dreissena polymorpha TaxID=45954 RepID=A0A9D4IZ54_DREPO|nr:hypothetical protein DPMN_168021 [Dreissena polymorpha]
MHDFNCKINTCNSRKVWKVGSQWDKSAIAKSMYCYKGVAVGFCHRLLFTAYTTAGRFTSCYKAVKAKSHYDAGGAPVRDQESTWMNRGPTGIPMLHRDEL